ncbi:DNA recombination protein RmuC [Pseudobacteriovorax antillogorgiicola]|uniref:DNA recombination protein RmuC n=1 Tax=Pseudobacteriovorax antillogorgiicola TaxID=1513793 RepID=A0A1Y6BRH2_9BACT|nr:DNA recombination protein RmuC [Pseudobacteriovorax antillogorgiicola]TCS53832.1 DNA recombination protein RmuC [Pseudobacteriovorax antillogorgiicola]SMF21742.1 DNA recombination protein RmuC [Pseudobacteriovorax antillogorgiicola]
MELLLGLCLGILLSLCVFLIYLRRKDQAIAMLQQERDSLDAELVVEKKLHEERKAMFASLEERLNQSFKSISSDVLSNSNRGFMQLAESVLSKYEEKAVQRFDNKEDAIGKLIEPIHKSLDHFNDHVHAIEKQRMVAYQSVKEQIDSLKDAHQSLMTETSRLAGALKSPTARGRWGEVQLRRVVELAGMLAHCDFMEQASLDADQKRLRPDMLVQLPGERLIAVDAKVPLQAYLEAMEEQDYDRRKAYLSKHAQQVKRQIMDLSKKSYWSAFEGSPEFVILFLPGESFFAAALEADSSLIELGAEQRVVVATPTTLIALLRTVALAWRQETLAANSKHIARLGKDLHQRVCDFSYHMADMGKHLKNSVGSYNKAVGTLETRLLVTTRKFKSLGIEEGKKEAAEVLPLDVDTRPLTDPSLF